MFTIHFGNVISLKGKIKILDKYLMSWGIDGKRKSYSMTGKIISYRKYFISQLKLIFTHFSFFHCFIPIIFLLVWMINGWIKRRMSPKKFDLEFEKKI